MNGELRAGGTTTGKRENSATDRAFDFRHVPVDCIPLKRPRPSSSSSSSSGGASRARSSRASSRSSDVHTRWSDSKLTMAELLAIKRELTVIKVQIDGLLDSVDKMDRQRKESSECTQRRELSVSPHRGSVSSMERESPEPGEASEDESPKYPHYSPYSQTYRTVPGNVL